MTWKRAPNARFWRLGAAACIAVALAVVARADVLGDLGVEERLAKFQEERPADSRGA